MLAASPIPSVATVAPQEIQVITAITGRPFTLDATVFPSGVTSTIAAQNCCATQPFTTRDVAGHHSCVCVPPSELKDYIAHYVEQKSKDPHNTSGCFAVPKWRILPRPSLATMQVIKQYRKGYHLMQRGSKRDKGLFDETFIYYDPPELVLPDTPHSKLLMQYKCHVHGAKATVLLDSGAEGCCYVNRRFLESRSIAFNPSAQPGVAYADGAQRPSYGKKTLTVHMQKYTAKLPCTIIDLSPQFDIILG